MSVNLVAGKKANLREIGNLDCSGYTRNAPKTVVFGAFCYAKSYNFQTAKKFDPHDAPHCGAVREMMWERLFKKVS